MINLVIFTFRKEQSGSEVGRGLGLWIRERALYPQPSAAQLCVHQATPQREAA